MEPALFIEDYKVPMLMILTLVAILVYLRVSGISQALIDQAPTDSSDPIAEADFHMAYGIYDKAAQAIRKALVAEPESADLVFKLLEIHFASGDGDEFLTLARFYKDKFGRSGHWDAIIGMGKELLPDERLFR